MFLAYTDSGKDDTKPLNVRFYAFGVEEDPAKIMDAHLLSRKLTRIKCKGKTWEDNPTGLCSQECHITCDPLAGEKLLWQQSSWILLLSWILTYIHTMIIRA